MNNKLIFTIQDKKFFTMADYADLSEFIVESTPRPYEVLLQNSFEVWLEINKLLEENSKNLLLIDSNVYKLIEDKLTVEQGRVYVIDSTEQAKTLEGCMLVVDFLQAHNFTKAEKLIVVGGGVVQDIGAFVGALFKRGIPWIFFPTTLLAMCDSCIGGKTGINYKGAKNQLALFSAPARVIINPNFLKTLPKQELKAGLGEVLKLHVTGGMESLKNYELMVKNGEVADFLNYKSLIIGSLMVKKAIIEVDEFDLGLRNSLNYGHTLGHALEAMTDFAIPHGQAVALGMVLVDELSCQKNILPIQEKKRVQKLCLDLMDNNVIFAIKNLSVENLVGFLKKDKKTMGSIVNFIVLRRIGDTIFLPVPLDDKLAQEAKLIIAKVFG